MPNIFNKVYWSLCHKLLCIKIVHGIFYYASFYYFETPVI